MNGMSPVDNKFFELIIPIATFLTGTLSGIMLAGDDKELRAKAIDAATRPYTPPPTPPTPPTTTTSFGPVPMAMGAAGATFAASSFISEPTEVKTVNGKPAPIQPDFPEI
jgi:hypothetical protein